MEGSIWDKVRDAFGTSHIINRIPGSKCRAYLDNLPERLIIDVEKFATDKHCASKRCDFAIFFCYGVDQRGFCVLIELKSGSFDAASVIEQFRFSACYIDNFLNTGKGSKVELLLCPVLLYGARMHRDDEHKLATAEISFRGQTSSIYRERCGVRGNVFRSIQRFLENQ